MRRLDRVEGLGAGYEKTTVRVRAAARTFGARTYIASPTHVDDSLRPYGWYRDLVVSGARTLSLPADYVEELRRTKTWKDEDRARARRNLVSLPCLPA